MSNEVHSRGWFSVGVPIHQVSILDGIALKESPNIFNRQNMKAMAVDGFLLLKE